MVIEIMLLLVVVGRVLGVGESWVGILMNLLLLFVFIGVLLDEIIDICIFLFFFLDGFEDFC